MLLTNERIDEIECLTWDILVEVYGSVNIIPPINLNKIAEHYGLSLRQGTFSDETISGYYHRKEKKILVNEKDSYQRRSFTVAHEFGHFFLHKQAETETFKRTTTVINREEETLQEQEANCFAASLLMPKPVVNKFCSIIKDPLEISMRFCVSSLTAHYRLKNLGLLHG